MLRNGDLKDIRVFIIMEFWVSGEIEINVNKKCDFVKGYKEEV